MATRREMVEYIVDQVAGVGEDGALRARRMFGEYALYLDTKVVALVCDDQLYVKVTDAGEAFAGGACEAAPPFEGAKPWMLVSEELLEDRTWLAELLRTTADALPLPKPKKKRAK